MITYLVGDATNPQVPGNKIIAHVCNDIGVWGRGFVLSLTRKFPEAEKSYRRWYQEQHDHEKWPPMKLGHVVFVPVAKDITVANMIAQHGIYIKNDGTPPIRYDALEKCLTQVAQWALDNDRASVHMPRIGCGLAGGKWSEVEPIIQRRLVDQSIDTYVYDFDANDARIVPWNK